MAISKKAASVIANDLDRLATLFESECDTLGVPKKVAVDFAMRCDLLSDYLEKNAAEDKEEKEEADEDNAGDEKEEKKEEESDEKEAGKKASLPEEDFAKDTEPSKVELQTEADEPYMEEAKEQTHLHELGDIVESDSLENAAKLAQLVLRMQSEIRNAHGKVAKKAEEDEKEANEEAEASEEAKESNDEKESSDEKEAKKAHSHGYNLSL